MTDRYEAIGCGVYEVDPTAKPGDPDERHPRAVCRYSALATRIADALNGSEALVTILAELTADLKIRYIRLDRGARNFRGELVRQTDKDELASMEKQLATASAAIASATPETEGVEG